MRRLLPIILIAAIVAVGICLAYVRAHREPGIEGPMLTVRFLDASVGDAIVLKTPEGNAVVVDTPSGRAETKALGDLLKNEHAREITVIVSNPSPEHFAALRNVMRAARVARIIRPELGSATARWEALLAGADGATESVLARGDRVKLSPTVHLEALSPVRETAQGGDDDSLVFRVTFGNESIFFPSDIRAEGESALVKSGLDLTSTVLVVGRHGQSGSTSLELLSMARPEIIVVSAWRGSGRPSASVLNRLSARNTGAALYRTDKDGIIEIDTNGHSIQVLTGGGEP